MGKDLSARRWGPYRWLQEICWSHSLAPASHLLSTTSFLRKRPTTLRPLLRALFESSVGTADIEPLISVFHLCSCRFPRAGSQTAASCRRSRCGGAELSHAPLGSLRISPLQVWVTLLPFFFPPFAKVWWQDCDFSKLVFVKGVTHSSQGFIMAFIMY